MGKEREKEKGKREKEREKGKGKRNLLTNMYKYTRTTHIDTRAHRGDTHTCGHGRRDRVCTQCSEGVATVGG